MHDLDITHGAAHPKFLTRCAEWIGEVPHLDLLMTLIDLNFDAAEPDAQNRPQPSSPNWISEEFTPDPLFLGLLSLLCKDNQGFAGITPLHEAVLYGSSQDVEKWISSSARDKKNFLGQTPLHFTVYKSKYLNDLILAGHNVNATYNYGITPLMYAAAENKEDSLNILLNAGADISLVDTRYHRNFFHYAAIRRNWALIYNMLLRIKSVAGKNVSASWAEYVTLLFHHVHPDYLGKSPVSLNHFLAECGTVDFLYDDQVKGVGNNSLLHDARSCWSESTNGMCKSMH
ncbi:Serine/threonine-protein phosphatase 6 regulatory ankyrin repeat subunit B [Colletotrichum fructicola Nara gc5]|uniref:Serine/threonine-protein phosphatase 6 regulatory ankyrin repeat subunit B n=1 Tax=Colletotrichum fructicola (strain Nara gc5) TaxID=1213859 RepID=A0A7J6IDV1_COLFN|nr:Serine/threonine-protein phosphatase 6 regulatory ankyrin repeat subunit B [Colletotrichum fructicola Nara gc5]